MKKFTAFLLALLMVMGCVGCGEKQNDAAEPTVTATPTAIPTDAPATMQDATEEIDSDMMVTPDSSTEEIDPEFSVTPENTVTAMTYEEYVAAALDTPVVIEAYVQGKQSWWDNKVTAYLQDEDGAYFVYGMLCSEEDYAKLAIGTEIRVTGFKAEWSGEVEIVDATFEVLDGTYVAEATDVTALLANEAELIKKQNMLVAFNGMTVESAAIYKWDGSGQEGDDLYFNVSVDGATYTFTVESYLCDASSEVYQAVKNLKVGDVVDLEGFLYWYEGVNPHITSVTVK